MQDMEVTYFHAYIDGVDFVFLDSPIFRHIENNIYGGNRLVKRLADAFSCTSCSENSFSSMHFHGAKKPYLIFTVLLLI